MGIIATVEVQAALTLGLSAGRRGKHNLGLLYYSWAVFTFLKGWVYIDLDTCRGCAGPPGPDLAKRDLNQRIPARVTTISGRCGGARAREGVGWGEVAQVRHDACRCSLETSRGCVGPPGPDLAKRDLDSTIPA